MFVSALTPCGPRCFRCKLHMLSGPELVVFFAFLMLFWTLEGVKGDEVWSSGTVRLCLELRFSVSVRVGFRWLMLA